MCVCLCAYQCYPHYPYHTVLGRLWSDSLDIFTDTVSGNTRVKPTSPLYHSFINDYFLCFHLYI